MTNDHHDDPHTPPGPHTLPDPPIDADVDLRHLDWMKLNIRKLYDSSFWKRNQPRPQVLLSGLRLWMTAWHEVPAGSLPVDDEDFLFEAAGLNHLVSPDAERDGLRTLSERSPLASRTLRLALDGFERHSDGRMYHKFIVEMALQAWGVTIARRENAANTNQKKKKKRRAQRPQSERIAHTERTHNATMHAVDGDVEGDRELRDDLRSSSRKRAKDDAAARQAPAPPEVGLPKAEMAAAPPPDNRAFVREFGMTPTDMVTALWQAASGSTRMTPNCEGLEHAERIITLVRSNPGMSLREDVFPAIAAASLRPGAAITSWGYFCNAIGAWHKNRKGGVAQPGAVPAANGHTKHPYADKAVQGRHYGGHSDIEWYDACAKWQADGTWDYSFSVALPGRRGSSCPDDVLAQLGIVVPAPGTPEDAGKVRGRSAEGTQERRPEVISKGAVRGERQNTGGLPTGVARLVVPEGDEVPF